MANDTTLRLRYPTGKTLYTQIEAPNGTVWNGTSYVAFLLASWATFATGSPETPSSSGRYVAQFPTSSPAGNYTWTIYLQAAGSPASTDVAVASGQGYWDGSTFGGASLDLTQSLSNTNAGTVGGALHGSWAQAFGKSVLDRTNKLLTIFGIGGPSTPLQTFGLDDGSQPTVRTPQ